MYVGMCIYIFTGDNIIFMKRSNTSVKLLVNIVVLSTVREFESRTPKKIFILETVGGDKRRLKQIALYGASGFLLLA